MEAVIDRIARRPVSRRITASLFELAVAVSWALVGLSVIPDRAAVVKHSLIGRELGIFTTAWSILFVVGGLSVVYGITAKSFRVRIAGLALLASGLLMEGIAAAIYSPEPRALIYFVYCGAAAFRAVLLTIEHKRGLAR